MSVDLTQNPSDEVLETEQRLFYRLVFILAAFIYPAWAFVNMAVFPGLKESLGTRVLVAMLPALSAAVTFVPRVPRRLLELLYFLDACAVTAHFFWLVALNDRHLAFVMVTPLVVAPISVYMPTPRSLLAYFALTVAAAIPTFTYGHASSEGMLMIAMIATSVVTFYPPLALRHRLFHRLGSASRDLRSVLDNAAAAIVRFDRAGRIVSFNRRATAMLGYAERELATKAATDIVDDEDRAAVEAMVAASGDAPRLAFLRIHGKSGRRLWVRTTWQAVDGNESGGGCVLVAIDATAERENGGLLQAQKLVLEALVGGAPARATLDLLVRLVHEHLDAAPCAAVLHQGSASRLELVAWQALEVAPLRRALERNLTEPSAWRNALASERPTCVADREQAPARDDLLLLEHAGASACWAFPMRSSADQTLGFVLLLTSKQSTPSPFEKRLVETLARLAALAVERERMDSILSVQRVKMVESAKMASLGEMAAGIAHEINTPLTVIGGRIDNLRRQLAPTLVAEPTLATALDSIARMSERIGKIIHGLRTFSRNADHDPMAVADLGSIVGDTIALCSEKFKNRGVALDIAVETELRISCRAAQISQVLLNLLHNALDAAEGPPEAWVRLRAATVAGRVEIAVEDSGPGVPLELRAKLFQPFFTTKDVDRGTGLGLSISRGIVGEHGGQIVLDGSAPHTRFIVTLPTVADAEAAA